MRLRCIRFGAMYTRHLMRKHTGYRDTLDIDDDRFKKNGKQYYRNLRVSVFADCSRAVA